MRYASQFMYVFLLCLLAVSPLAAQQNLATQQNLAARQDLAAGQDIATVYEAVYRDAAADARPVLLPDGTEAEEKSGFVAVLYSLALPGMGELYADRFDRGIYNLVAEAGLWLGLVGVNSYGDWIQNDARLFARQHTGLDPAGKDDRFYVNIENYSDLYDYNNQMLIERRLDEMYPDEAAYQWAWDSDAHRTEYKDQRISADEMHNAVTFFVLGMVANRVWSAIQSAAFVRSHNANLLERLGSLPSMNTRITSFAGRTDGVQFTFTW